MMSGLRFGVLSAAHGHAIGYLRYLASRGDLSVMLADPDAPGGDDNRRRGRGLAEDLGVRWADSAEELLETVDAVVVCSENARHHGHVMAALKAGCHVLCEKPLAIDVDDAQEMVAAAAEAGLVLGVAHPVRQAPAYRHLVARAGAGQIGSLLSVLGTNNGMLPRDADWFVRADLSGGGALVDHVVHCADLVDGLLGVPAQRVRAVSNRILEQSPPTEVETGAVVTVEYESGVIATIDCSWSQPPSAPTWGGLSLDVIGTSGRVRIDPFNLHVGGHAAGGPQWWAYGADLDTAMLDNFVEAVRGEGEVASSGAAGLRCVQIMCAALESAASGGRVVEVEAG
ncbi:MAG TPA: Gfo/Idh/MocA family oxidoreductase [Acidimicrobiales bacterium]|nr:Gfo/Idh/MocA family oxidoreductase [Acidimicrobiales bacterium]